MKFVLENEVLTVFLEGRLDFEGSCNFDSEIAKICKETQYNRLVIDASNLEYVSSTGLRVVLKIAKCEKDFFLVNVSQQVYNVFEMTGFTRIIKIEKALRRINLDECELIGHGGMGAIYRVSEEEIVKVNFIQSNQHKLDLEKTKSKEAFVLGVPTAISFDLVDCGEGKRGVVYETIKSKTLGEMIQTHPEQMEELTDRYVAQLKALHRIHTDNPVFESAKVFFNNMLKTVANFLTEDEVAKMQMVLDAMPEGDILQHGDAHSKNIMVQGEEMFWIDMEMMSVGHPIYDLIAIAVVIKISTGDESSLKIAGMDMANLDKFRKCFIKKYFEIEKEEDFAKFDKMMDMLRLVRRAFAIGIDSPLIAQNRPKMIEAMRTYFFPRVEQIVGVIKYMVSIC